MYCSPISVFVIRYCVHTCLDAAVHATWTRMHRNSPMRGLTRKYDRRDTIRLRWVSSFPRAFRGRGTLAYSPMFRVCDYLKFTRIRIYLNSRGPDRARKAFESSSKILPERLIRKYGETGTAILFGLPVDISKIRKIRRMFG